MKASYVHTLVAISGVPRKYSRILSAVVPPKGEKAAITSEFHMVKTNERLSAILSSEMTKNT